LIAIDEAAGNGADMIVFSRNFVAFYPLFFVVLPPLQQGKPHLHLYEQAVTVPSGATPAASPNRCRPTRRSFVGALV